MKRLIIAVLTLISANALGYNDYHTTYHNCSVLNRFIEEEGTVILNYQLFFGGSGYHHRSRKSCSPCFRGVAANVKASDKFCRVGTKCVKLSREKIKKINRRRRERGQRRLNCRLKF